MKVLLFLLVVVPLVLSAAIDQTGPIDHIEDRLSIDDIIRQLQSLDLSGGCVQACEAHIGGFWQFLCSAACKILLDQTG